MRQETEAITRFRPTEWLVWTVLLALGVWAGVEVWRFVNQGAAVPARYPAARTGPIGPEWTEAPDFDRAGSVQQWAKQQQSLGRRLRRLERRVLDFGMLYVVKGVNLQMPSGFDDFLLRPTFPLPGSALRLGQGPTCVSFAWSGIPVSGVRYTLEIAKTRDFAFYRSFGSDNPSLAIEVAKKADYFWRVRALLNSQTKVSPVSSLLVLPPRLSEEELRTREIATRVVRPDAWLADLRPCR